MAATDNAVHHRGYTLPPPDLRWGGPKLLDHDAYLGSARRLAGLLERRLGLGPTSRVLDVGCGQGRLVIGMQQAFGAPAEYVGVDVHEPSVAWAQTYLATADGAVRFVELNARNERYNPEGAPVRDVAFPPSRRGEGFHAIVMWSLFSHLRLADVSRYLVAARDVLARNGALFLTAFVEHGVPAEEENPPGYLREWSGPLHCVRFDRHRFEDLVYESGLTVRDLRYRHTRDGQSSYVLELPRPFDEVDTADSP